MSQSHTLAIGTTRNLTQQFVRYRSDAKRARLPDIAEDRFGGENDKATAKLLGAALGSSDGDIELGGISTGYAPRWVQVSEKIKSEMSVLRERITRLREAHAKAALVTFDSGGSGAGAQVDALTREVQLGFRRLDGEIRSMGQAGGREEDAGVRLQVQRQLAQALFKLSVEFRKEETRFLNKIEAQKGYEAGSSIGLVEDDGGGGGGLGDPGFTQAQLMKMSQAEALIEERDTEIRKVVETIVELATIMRDLSTLVVEQGTMLDRIDHNIQETAMKVEDGVQQLVRAERSQKSGRAMQCILRGHGPSGARHTFRAALIIGSSNRLFAGSPRRTYKIEPEICGVHQEYKATERSDRVLLRTRSNPSFPYTLRGIPAALSAPSSRLGTPAPRASRLSANAAQMQRTGGRGVRAPAADAAAPGGDYCIVTGANSGIGKEVAAGLMARGHHVVLACRNMDACGAAAAELAAAHPQGVCECSRVDLEDPASIRAFAARHRAALKKRGAPLRVLVNNAGIMGPASLPDGTDRHLWANHLGPYLLTRLLLPSLGGGGRVVTVASRAHYFGGVKLAPLAPAAAGSGAKRAPLGPAAAAGGGGGEAGGGGGGGGGGGWRFDGHPSHWFSQYCRSKLLNVGAATAVWAATAPEAAGGMEQLFLHDCKPLRPSALALDAELAAAVWDASAREVGLTPDDVSE
ncbi:MAG: hypothetical protein J3K34DRAFT_458972 [Monoraphidium minutum]|nr:MAG: hypothetical protein J3K34DRAFT_458972 [Monoraphidium minutum]